MARPVARPLAVALVPLTALGAAGCGGDPTGEEAFDTKVAVYVGVPLRGPWAERGQAIADGARLAMADSGGGVGTYSVRLSFQDITDPADQGRLSASGAAGAAGTALRDQGAIGMVAGLEPTTTREQVLLASQTGLSVVTVDGDRPAGSLADRSPRGQRLFVDLAAADRRIAHELGARARVLRCARPTLIAVGITGERLRLLRDALPGARTTVVAPSVDVPELSAEDTQRTTRAASGDAYADDRITTALRRADGCVVLAGEPAAGDPATAVRRVGGALRGTRLLLTRGTASPGLARLAAQRGIAAEAIVDGTAAGDSAESRRIDRAYREVFGRPAPVGVQAGWRATKLLLRAVGGARRGNWRSDVAAALVRAPVPGPPAEGRQAADGSVSPAPVGLAVPDDGAWRITRTLAR